MEFRHQQFRHFAEARRTYDGSLVWHCRYEAHSVADAMISSSFSGCEFVDVDWTNTKFSGAKFVHCHFKDCRFGEASFEDTLFAACEFEGCGLPSGVAGLNARIVAMVDPE